MKICLVCAICKESIIEKRHGIFVWGFDTGKFPFTFIHRVCDNNRDDSVYNMDGFVFSMDVEDLLARVCRKLKPEEVTWKRKNESN